MRDAFRIRKTSESEMYREDKRVGDVFRIQSDFFVMGWLGLVGSFRLASGQCLPYTLGKI